MKAKEREDRRHRRWRSERERERERRSSGAAGGASGAMLQFYTDDAPGLKFSMGLTLALTLMPTSAFMPYPRSLWDFPEDPFRILEQSPLTIPKSAEPLTLARADWRETGNAHIITIDVPGIKKQDIKIEMEENRVLRISGERKAEEDVEVEKWHRAERVSGKFWRQFRMPGNADPDGIRARLEDGVLTVIVPKLAEEKRRQPKVIDVVADSNEAGQDINATKTDA